MRSAEYGIAHQRIGAETKQALVFGEACHLAWKYRYKFCGAEPVSEENQIKQFILLEEFWRTHPTPIGDHRTLGFAQLVVEEYNRYWKRENFRILQTKDGRSVVEEGFAIPLGTIGKYKIVWKGRIDLGVEEIGDIWVIDHKTTKMGGEYYMLEFFTSNQMKGYTWALRQLLGAKVKGAQVNAQVVRKITKTGKGIEFMRGKFPFDDEMLEEWQRNTLEMVGDFLHSYERGYFTMSSSQCNHKYGPCQYIGVCTMAPATRFQELYSGEHFKDDKFDPLHEDAVDLQKIHDSPIPSNYKRVTQIEPTVQVGVDVESVMKDLLG